MELLAYHPDLISKKQLDNYLLSTEQLKFSDSPLNAIEKAKVDKDRYPIFLTHDRQLLVSLTLHINEGPKIYTNKPNTILLRSFSTNHDYQGKGYAKTALLLLPEYIRQQFPHITEIILGVNAKNIAAIHLYEKTGFIDKGQFILTEYGKLKIMTQKI
ncbi:GNAT family N-acetyltransferase [Vagococcus hydrophili]|uniref:GNAT family N-acetyltransferase n=1 Tax=Vagococcus hydrophili TaxID=2714947 RepID=A0A6G8ASS0_9ENTE|nr:GNAT family N-acetyltransferase [Vagococcus hydrophili]QIL48121.1 GNAT family N-acetyltransferase [Vagococcus hydrophili]